jgi:uncharacterized membrane protein
MLRIAATYLAMGIAFALVDAVWLSQVGPGVYRPTLDAVLRPPEDPLNLPAAVVFYLAYIAGILAIAVWPNRERSLRDTAVAGALLGAMAYATYDLTNQATLKVWSTTITVADIAWGTFITALAATIGGWVLRRLTKA